MFHFLSEPEHLSFGEDRQEQTIHSNICNAIVTLRKSQSFSEISKQMIWLWVLVWVLVLAAVVILIVKGDEEDRTLRFVTLISILGILLLSNGFAVLQKRGLVVKLVLIALIIAAITFFVIQFVEKKDAGKVIPSIVAGGLGLLTMSNLFFQNRDLDYYNDTSLDSVLSLNTLLVNANLQMDTDLENAIATNTTLKQSLRRLLVYIVRQNLQPDKLTFIHKGQGVFYIDDMVFPYESSTATIEQQIKEAAEDKTLDDPQAYEFSTAPTEISYQMPMDKYHAAMQNKDKQGFYEEFATNINKLVEKLKDTTSWSDIKSKLRARDENGKLVLLKVFKEVTWLSGRNPSIDEMERKIEDVIGDINRSGISTDNFSQIHELTIMLLSLLFVVPYTQAMNFIAADIIRQQPEASIIEKVNLLMFILFDPEYELINMFGKDASPDHLAVMHNYMANRTPQSSQYKQYLYKHGYKFARTLESRLKSLLGVDTLDASTAFKIFTLYTNKEMSPDGEYVVDLKDKNGNRVSKLDIFNLIAEIDFKIPYVPYVPNDNTYYEVYKDQIETLIGIIGQDIEWAILKDGETPGNNHIPERFKEKYTDVLLENFMSFKNWNARAIRDVAEDPYRFFTDPFHIRDMTIMLMSLLFKEPYLQSWSITAFDIIEQNPNASIREKIDRFWFIMFDPRYELIKLFEMKDLPYLHSRIFDIYPQYKNSLYKYGYKFARKFEQLLYELYGDLEHERIIQIGNYLTLRKEEVDSMIQTGEMQLAMFDKNGNPLSVRDILGLIENLAMTFPTMPTDDSTDS